VFHNRVAIFTFFLKVTVKEFMQTRISGHFVPFVLVSALVKIPAKMKDVLLWQANCASLKQCHGMSQDIRLTG
jgi:hypothetical protein